jgi:Cu/Ag efflux protein CusF
MRLVLFFILLSIALVSCARKPEPSGPERHYQLIGKIISVDAKHQTATIDAAATPGFMEAMTMEYPIKSKAEFDMLQAGNSIQATVNVSASGTDYNLSDIRKQNGGK